MKMVADMQEWGGGEVPGRKLETIIDSLHFVSSHAVLACRWQTLSLTFSSAVATRKPIPMPRQA
jgi:hypothetical protein